jgi:hypothetical protein
MNCWEDIHEAVVVVADHNLHFHYHRVVVADEHIEKVEPKCKLVFDIKKK